MKKLLLISLFIPLTTSAARLIEVRLHNEIVFADLTEKELAYSLPGIAESKPREKCREASVKYFKSQLSTLSKKSLPVTKGELIDVVVFDQHKKVSKQSPLGRYALNLPQHLLTLKNEMELSCKRK